MVEMYFFIIGALAATGIVATAIAVLRDGYRRSPTWRPMREYERDEHYRP